MLISGHSQAEHDGHLRQVLCRFARAGLNLKKEKRELYQEKVRYLGYVRSACGLHPDPSKVHAIQDAPDRRMLMSCNRI